MRPPLSRKADTNDGSPVWVAQIAHSCPSRTRLSFADLKGRPAQLIGLCDRVVKLKGVRQADARAVTGSLIVTHDGSSDDLVLAAKKAGVFDVQDHIEHQFHADADAWQEWIDRTLKDAVGNGIDVRTLGAFAFFAMALRQLASGHIMPPAATALLYALNLLSSFNKADPGALDGNGGS